MTEAQIRSSIEASLGSVPFQAPLTVEYCTAVRDDLRKRVPPGASIEVCFTPSSFVVEIRAGAARCSYKLALR